MSKRDLSRVTTDLASLAETVPTQRSPEARSRPKAEPGEEITQFSMSLRKSLRKEIAARAADADMTMRSFILLALREKGLNITDDDLADLRKR